MVNEDDTLFRFQFMLKMRYNNKNMCRTVYSSNRLAMELFLKQHNFDMSMVNIECISVNDIDGDEGVIENNMLTPHLFHSNYSNELFTIMTTPAFVHEAIEDVCSELSDSLVFGSGIIRTDIQIIEMINDLLYELPHVYILDHMIVDPESGEPYESNNLKYIKNYHKFENLGMCFDDIGIYDSMFDASIIDKPQPITVEAYASYFTDLITDEIT